MTRNTHVLLLLLVGIMALTVSFNISNAQEKQKIPLEFFAGKWAGELKGYYWSKTDGTINFSIDYDGINFGGNAILYPWGLNGGGTIYVVGSKDRPHHFIVEGNNKGFLEGLCVMGFMFDPGETMNLRILGLVGLFSIEPLDFSVDLDNSVIKINHVGFKDDRHQKFVVNGEIYKITRVRKTFPKDIKPNELIKTDKKTQVEITMPDVGKVNIALNTEAKIKCSVCLLEVGKGRIHGLIKELKQKTKFDVKTPISVAGIRGTEYALSVEDDGTTTVVVLDGEVEFSDKENKKTVMVKKNQKSVVKPGALPTDPEEIDPKKILNWWE